MKKIKIPHSHYCFLRSTYTWLSDTLAAGMPGGGGEFPGDHLARQVLDNYRLRLSDDEPTHKLDTVFKSADEQTVQADPTMELMAEVESCKACPLSIRRRSFVKFGIPDRSVGTSSIMVLTDIPDYYDEVQGRYFADKSGELLRKIITAMELDYDRLYITGALKCASAEVITDPQKHEVCIRHLGKELDLFKPRLILAFGKLTYRLLFKTEDFDEIRGKTMTFRGTPIVFTRHPRDLLYDPALKRDTWEDLKKHREKIQAILYPETV